MDKETNRLVELYTERDQIAAALADNTNQLKEARQLWADTRPGVRESAVPPSDEAMLKQLSDFGLYRAPERKKKP